jgi:LruC domain-containing protein
MKRIYPIFIALLVFALFTTYCSRDEEPSTTNSNPTDITDLIIEDGFNWSMTKTIDLRLEAKTNNGQPLRKIRMYVYDADPGDGAENLNNANLIYSGFTNDQGVFEAQIITETYLSKLYVKPQYIGLMEKAEVEIVNGKANFTFGGTKSMVFKNHNYIEYGKRIAGPKGNLNTLGTWDSQGVPNYLTTGDNISSSLLADINASLPEYSRLPDSHPQYLVDGAQANLELIDSCDVWVTFVHEGAGYRNVLGYYSYPTNSPPTSASDLNDMTVIFPNVSKSGSGGGLNPGDKVYIGSFGAGTTIGWFIVANGYNYSQQQITGNIYYYSDPDLNPESTASNRKHMVLLNDDVQNLLVMGFEDINRESSSCDHDFNDAVFYASANPITAIKTDEVPQIDTPGDDDNDGISDRFDDYPGDPTAAMNNYYPSETEYGTLAFEDMWPNRGDYDFNDLVVDYQYNSVTNGDNKVIQVRASIILRAIGAGYHNGFGWQMNLAPSEISQVSGCNYAHNYISLNANGTEAGQSKANIIAFDNAFYVLQPNGGSYVNTVVGDPYTTPDTMHITITMNSPQTIANVGFPPYNPYLIVDKARGVEVHLPSYEPTDLADQTLFGTFDDNTNVAQNRFYRSKTNLPWAMNVPSSFVYPKEKSSILNGHLMFGQWAQSSGFSFMDWYDDKLGYRDNNHLFIPTK